jgi:hypothetical protein
MSPKRKIQ